MKLPEWFKTDAKYRRLSTDDKSTIRRMYYREKATMTEIADEIGCHVSTISRFLDGEDERRQRAEEEERKKDPLAAIMRLAQQRALNDPGVAARVEKAAEKKLLASLGEDDATAFPDNTKGFVASIVHDLTKSPEVIGLLGRFIPESEAHKIAQQMMAERNYWGNAFNAAATKLKELGVDPATLNVQNPPAITQQDTVKVEEVKEQPVRQPLSLDESMQLLTLVPHLERWVTMSPDQAAAEAAPLIASGQASAKVLDVTAAELRTAVDSDVAKMMVPEGLRSALMTEQGGAWWEAFRQAIRMHLAPGRSQAGEQPMEVKG